jgi:hypothetical protein
MGHQIGRFINKDKFYTKAQQSILFSCQDPLGRIQFEKWSQIVLRLPTVQLAATFSMGKKILFWRKEPKFIVKPVELEGKE